MIFLHRPLFADTLEKLAEAADRGTERFGFYDGPIGKAFVDDLSRMGGIMTMEDLKSYEVICDNISSVYDDCFCYSTILSTIK